MGSFHTNGKSISIQLMERFLDMSAYIPSKWPSEYVNEFLPVLEQFKYQHSLSISRDHSFKIQLKPLPAIEILCVILSLPFTNAVGNQMKYNSWRKYARLS